MTDGDTSEKNPSAVKVIPITGTIGTEKAPAAITATPYKDNQTPGIVDGAPPVPASTMVSTAPTINGGTKLKANFRVGGDHSGVSVHLALRYAETKPITPATIASIIQTRSQAYVEGCWLAT